MYIYMYVCIYVCIVFIYTSKETEKPAVGEHRNMAYRKNNF